VISTERFEQVEVASTIELEAWLAEHHAQHEAIWLVTYKKAVPGKYVSRVEVLDLLVAFGWIDGIRRQRDEKRTMQLVSPRRTKPWAKTYKDRAERLIATGRMRQAGLESVHLAKASGAWEAMNDVDMLVAPDRAGENPIHPGQADRASDTRRTRWHPHQDQWLTEVTQPHAVQRARSVRSIRSEKGKS